MGAISLIARAKRIEENKMSNKLLEKYRPSLTLQQIQYILHVSSLDTSIETEDIRISLTQQLKLLTFKASIGATAPSYVSPPKISLEDKLGIGLSAAEKRELAYRKYSSNPALCTAQEREQALTYMYDNNMMIESEAAAFEKEFM